MAQARARARPRAAAAALALAALCGFAASAAADTVVLRNGRKLHGKVLREDAKLVVLRVDGGGEMKIDRTTVREIVRSADPPAAPPTPPVPTPDAEPSPTDGAAPAPPVAPPPAPETLPAAAGGTDILRRTAKWRVPQGTLAAAVEGLAQQAGLTVRTTENGAALLRDGGASREYESEGTFGGVLRHLLLFGTSGRLKHGIVGRELVLGLAHEVCGEAPRAHGRGLVWSDATGEVERSGFDPPNWKRPDLREVSVRGQNGRLEIRLAFTGDVDALLAQQTPKGTMKGYDLAEVFLDLDDDPATGRAISWDEKRTGWEHCVQVSTGLEIRDKGGMSFKQWGNIESIQGVHTVLRPLVTYSARATDSSGGMRFVDPNDKETPDKLTTVSGREIVALVPYRVLGVKAGQRVRACVVDDLEPLLSDDKITRPGTIVLE